MAEQDQGTSEMEHAREVLQIILVARSAVRSAGPLGFGLPEVGEASPAG